jgi:hypothetical protein
MLAQAMKSRKRRALDLPRGRSKCRQWRQQSGNVCLREALGQQSLDLGLGLVLGRRQQLLGILGRELRRQQAHAAHVQPALGDGFEDRGEVPGRMGRLHALPGDVFGDAQLAHAVGMHRGICGRRVEPASVHLGQMREHPGGGDAVLSDERREIPEQHVIGEVSQRVTLHGATPRGAKYAGATCDS